jgi:hypothetical protein
MSPPSVWGPAVWTLFHTLAEKIKPSAYEAISPSLFYIIVRICKYLPCPDCSKDASNFLAKINIKDYKTKIDFKNLLYLFHNWVNAKKKKPLFNYENINKYSKLNLIVVINNFIDKYNTKGNMNLLAESFQRMFVIKEIIGWFKKASPAFVVTNVDPILVENNISVTALEPIQETNEDVASPTSVGIENVDVSLPVVGSENIDVSLPVVGSENVDVSLPVVEEPIVGSENVDVSPPIEEPEVGSENVDVSPPIEEPKQPIKPSKKKKNKPKK